jgi:Ran GTPase-activating protein (RanGAP) involved in mRNA processing and transport
VGALRSESFRQFNALLYQAFCQNTALQHLILWGNDLRNVGALRSKSFQQFNTVLCQNTTLQHLIQWGNGLRNAGLADIASGFYRSTSIKTLDLSSNGLDDIESASVLRELLCRNKTITRVRLAENTFGRNAAAVRSIFEGLRNNTALQQLDLHDCGLGDQGISILANALAVRNASILELDLRRNKITSVGVRVLVDDNAEAVETLAKLYLAYNPVKNEGATILANALGRNDMPDLTRLYLQRCGIEDDGFVALVSALEQNTSLQILSLAGNYFSERSFMALAERFPHIKGLQEITFVGNESFQSTLPL